MSETWEFWVTYTCITYTCIWKKPKSNIVYIGRLIGNYKNMNWSKSTILVGLWFFPPKTGRNLHKSFENERATNSICSNRKRIKCFFSRWNVRRRSNVILTSNTQLTSSVYLIKCFMNYGMTLIVSFWKLRMKYGIRIQYILVLYACLIQMEFSFIFTFDK